MPWKQFSMPYICMYDELYIYIYIYEDRFHDMMSVNKALIPDIWFHIEKHILCFMFIMICIQTHLFVQLKSYIILY